ncbi:LUD domain-containing protein [Nonomuraea sp. NPDC049480]|uniref:LUD domain-containing protein n=1 Tax=Nonomuraea sp. NPDC049480 TaxID=3364353 RepID=UPI00379DED06
MTVQDPVLDETFAAPADATRLERAAAALQERGYTVHLVDSADEARARVVGLLPRDTAVFTASSQTLRQAGIAADIDESGAFVSVRRQAGDLGGDHEARIRLGGTAEVIVGSVHAVTEDGRMVVASASGSQLAPYAAGARKAIWVVGAQKVVPDLDTALRRIRAYSLPLESRRVAEVYNQPTFIGKILILEREAMPGRGTVVLIREPIGF